MQIFKNKFKLIEGDVSVLIDIIPQKDLFDVFLGDFVTEFVHRTHNVICSNLPFEVCVKLIEDRE